MSVDRVTIVAGKDLVSDSGATGIVRHAAVDDPELWAGLSSLDAGIVSDWHHHGSNTTVFYMLSGRLTVEYGSEGQSAVARQGDFVVVPPGIVHREITHSDANVEAAVVRFGDGRGPLTVEVDSPDAATDS